MDFDDLLLLKPVQLLEQHPDHRRDWQERFTHILVDEYQDINPIQDHLLDLLGGHGHLTIVGDDAQSIYGWRGTTTRQPQPIHPALPAIYKPQKGSDCRPHAAASSTVSPNNCSTGETSNYPLAPLTLTVHIFAP